MFIHRRPGWLLPASAVTPEALVTGRRKLLGGALGAALGGIAGGVPSAQAQWRLFSGPPPKMATLSPLTAKPNGKYAAGRAVTPEKAATTYNNYYEFSTDKDVLGPAQALPTEKWTIKLDGMVKTPRTIGYDDLLKQVSLEERIYRHRCVETWAMTVPWIGFPQTQVFYDRADRVAGETHYPFRKMLRFAFDGIASMSTKPLRLTCSRCCCSRCLSVIFSTFCSTTLSVAANWCRAGRPSCRPSRFLARFNYSCSAYLGNILAAFTNRRKIGRYSSFRKSSAPKNNDRRQISA